MPTLTEVIDFYQKYQATDNYSQNTIVSYGTALTSILASL